MITVKELLKRCDRSKLCDEYARLCRIPTERMDEFTPKFQAFIDELMQLEAIRAVETVVVNSLAFDYSMEPFIDSSAFNISEVMDNFLPIPYFDILDSKDLNALTDSQVKYLLDKLYAFKRKYYSNVVDSYFGGYAYEYCEWPQILGFLIPDSVTDRHKEEEYAAPILSEMAFFGFDIDDKQEEKQKLDDRIKQSEEFGKLPEEEQKKYYKTYDELNELIGYKDNRTPPEIRQEKLISNRAELLSEIYGYRSTRDLYNELK